MLKMQFFPSLLTYFVTIVSSFNHVAFAAPSLALADLNQQITSHGFVFERNPKAVFDFGIETNMGTGTTYFSSDKLTSRDSTQTFFGAMATPLSNDLLFSVTLSHGSFATQTTTQLGNRRKSIGTSSNSSIFAGPILFIGQYSVGGAVGVYSMGDRRSENNFSDGIINQDESSSLVPTLHVYAGRDTGATKFAIGLQLPNSVETDVAVSDENDKVYHKSAKANVGMEVWLDSRVQVFDKVQVAAGVVYNFDENASRPADDETPSLISSSSQHSEARSDAQKRQKNYAQLRLEGVYSTESNVDLSARMKYFQPSYATPEYANPEIQNLESVQIEVGSQFKFTNARLGMNAGYAITRKVNFTVSDTKSAPWAELNESGSTKRSGWIFRSILSFSL